MLDGQENAERLSLEGINRWLGDPDRQAERREAGC
jgi:hypothetical protein